MKSGLLPVLLGLSLVPHARAGSSWENDLEVFPKVRTIEAPEGYRIHRAPGGPVIKEVGRVGSLNVKAAVIHDGARYYMSDWSWDRYAKGIAPNWVALVNPPPLKVAPPVPTPVTPPVAAEEAKPAAKERETKVALETIVLTPVPEGKLGPAPLEVARKTPPREFTPSAAPRPEPKPKASTARPGSAAYRIEKEWGGTVEVFASQRDFPAPEGYDIMAQPKPEAKVLKRIGSKSTVTAKACLTLESGEVFFTSNWSWDRAKAGRNPTWIHIDGHAECAVSPTLDAPGEPGVAASRPDFDAPTGRVVALFIGNGRYSSRNPGHRSLDLSQPRKDVELLATHFRGLGSEVTVQKDLNRDAMARAIEDATASLQPGDVFVFYYAGHGLQVGGKNYLAPLDVSFLDNDAVRRTTISVDEMLTAVTRTKARLGAFILDSCRPNPFNKVDISTHIARFFPGLRSSAARTGEGLAHLDVPAGCLVAYSAAPGQSSQGANSGPHSPYARALAQALKTDGIELREALDRASDQVQRWTKKEQAPWRSSEELPRYYPQLPSRFIATPDDDTRQAGRWLASSGPQGVPLAMAQLARSVAREPRDNAASAALLYLLSYQAVPVPLQSWGPFRLNGKETLSPDLQVSINGRYFGLFEKGKEDGKASFILDRDTGRTVTSIEDSFMPQDDSSAATFATVDDLAAEDGQPVSVWSVQREAWGAEDTGDEPDPHATAPILCRGTILASHFDEGLERIYLATREKDGLHFRAYAVTPAVDLNPALARSTSGSRLPEEGRGEQILSRGKLTVADGPDVEWALSLSASGEVLLTLNRDNIRYRRPGGRRSGTRLDDWLVDERAREIVLLYRNAVEMVSFDGEVRLHLPVTWPESHRGTILGYSASFRRLLTASWDGEMRTARKSRIEIFDVRHAETLRREDPFEGYPQFAALTPDSEWFLYYDKNRRLRMIDSATGGAMLDLPSTRAPMPLPVPGLEPGEDDAFFAPAFKASPPPFLREITNYYSSPAWLPDLAHAITGFRMNEEGQVTWLDDAPDALRETVKAMTRKSNNRSDKALKEWTEWFQLHRLAALGES